MDVLGQADAALAQEVHGAVGQVSRGRANPSPGDAPDELCC